MKNKILAFVLAMAMTICLFPSIAQGASAESITRYTYLYQTSGGGISTTTQITLEVDFGKMTGTANFVRTEAKLTFTAKSYPTSSQKLQELMKEGSATFTVTNKPDFKSFAYKLYDFSWKTEPYILGVDYKNNAYENGIPVNIYLVSDRKHYTDLMSIQYPSSNVQSHPRFEEVADKYVFGEDNFSFSNSFSSVYPSNSASVQGPGIVYLGERSQSGKNGYYIKPDSYKTMTNGLSNSEIAAVNTMMNKAFFGNCFGMSVTSGLFFDGKLQLSQFDSSAKTVYELGKPLNNAFLREAIVYYQLSQNLGSVVSVKQAAGWGETSNNLGLVNALSSSLPSPVVFNIVINEDGKLSGHALLAYDMKDSNSAHVISVYDPNYPNTPLTLTISSDGKKASFATTYKDVSIGYSMKASSIANNASFNTSLKPCKVPAGGAVVTANTGTLTLRAGEETASFVDGKKVSGNLAATCIGPLNDSGEETEVLFLMNPLTGKGPVLNYRVSGSRSFTKDNLKIQARFAGTNGESFVSVQSENDCDLSMNTNGTIEVKQTSEKKMQISYASDQTKDKLFGTTVCGIDIGFTLVSGAGGTIVHTETGSKADILVSGKTESISFKNVSTAKPVEIQSNGLDCTIVSDGKSIASGKASEVGASQTQKSIPEIETNLKNNSKLLSQKIGNAIKNEQSTSNDFLALNYEHSAWARNELARAQLVGLIPDDITNHLEKDITRAEFAELVYQTIHAVTLMSDAEMNQFLNKPGSDNPYASQYSSRAIQFVYGTGIVGGYPDGSFDPNRSITRSEAAKMLVGTATVMGKLMNESNAKRFNDAPNDWSQSYINKISSISSPYSGIAVMGGDTNGNFAPSDSYTCEQAVITMLRLAESCIGEMSGL